MNNDNQGKDIQTWTCRYCIKSCDWVHRDCYDGMCRYSPEIYLIQRGLLGIDDVKFGEWNPKYCLTSGEEIVIENKKKVGEVYQRLKNGFEDGLETISGVRLVEEKGGDKR